MGEKTEISWTDSTFNPWLGCTKVSPGCANCYAETLMDHRYHRVKWGKGQPRQRTSAANWKQPLRWNRDASGSFQQVEMRDGAIHRGTIKEMAALNLSTDQIVAANPARPRVFCASLADWLDDEVPIEWLADLLKLIHDTPNLDWLMLSKRIEDCLERLGEVLNWIDAETNGLRDKSERGQTLAQRAFFVNDWLSGGRPPANIWLGVTVENQEYADKRIPELLKIPARVRFLSCEPLLSAVDLKLPSRSFGFPKHITSEGHAVGMPQGIHWVIAGGESSQKARPMHPDWFRSIRDQCQAAGVAMFMKQMGGTRDKRAKLEDLPEDLRIREFPLVGVSTITL